MEVVFKPEYKEAIDNNIEIWAPIGVEGFGPYEVSSHARFRNIARKEKFLKHQICPDNYSWVAMQRKISTGYTTKVRGVSVWVAETFLIKPVSDEKLTVDHIDRNRQNNDIHNLRWATAKQQRHNTTPHKNKRSPVNQYDKNDVLIRRWDSVNAAVASDTRFNINTIRSNCHNHSKSAYGYVWKYDKSDLEGEEWKIHPDMGISVSNKGRIITKLGFPTAGNVVDGKDYVTVEGKAYIVARLVAETFHGKHEGETVVHIDKNLRNNDPKNLKFGGITKIILRPNAKPGPLKVCPKPVLQIDRLTKKIIAHFDSAKAAAIALKRGYNEIKQVCNRKSTSIGRCRYVAGYKWRYVDHPSYKEKFKTLQQNERKRKRDDSEEEEVTKRMKYDK